MHSALYIDEALRSIISHLESRKDSLRFALTCRDVLEPALDALWREVDLNGFKMLRHLWPGDATAIDPTTGSLSLTRNLGAHEWARFDNYSKRVRCVKTCDLTSIADSCCRALCQSMKERAHRWMLPAAIEHDFLRFKLGSSAQLHLLKHLLPPNLKSLGLIPWHSRGMELTVEEGTRTMVKILEDCNFTTLEGLRLPYYFTSPAETPIPFTIRLAEVLQKNRSLRELYCRLPVSEIDIIEAAGPLPSLETLGLTSWGFQITPDEAKRQCVQPKRWFPSLHTIWADSLATYRLITSYSRPQALTTIRATISTADDLRDFFATLRECLALTNLFIVSPMTDDAPELALSLDSLLQCRGMESFHIDSSLVTPPTDRDLISVSVAWPRLERFSWSTPLPGRATLKALDAFAVNCRKLRELSIPIVIRAESTSHSQLHPFCSGVVLSLRDWTVVDVDAEALIDALTVLAPPGWSSEDHDSKWLSLHRQKGDVWKAVEEKFGDRKRRRGERPL